MFDKEDLHILEESVDFEAVKEEIEDDEDEDAEEKPEGQVTIFGSLFSHEFNKVSPI